MILVETSQNGWQSRMKIHMKRKEIFLLITTSKKIAYQFILKLNHFKAIGKLFLGSGLFGCAGWGVHLASDHTPPFDTDINFKIAMALIIILFVFVLFWMVNLIKYLIGGKYYFIFQERNSIGEWVIRAEPKKRISEKSPAVT